ncbi:MAG: ABC transporter ATP-binding protein [Bacteroidaceae bacterium]|nr:ABC transporter ATP-binding protein [Bacteroidaceae bacterium]
MQVFINALNGIMRVGLDFAFIWATKMAIDVATGAVTSPKHLLGIEYMPTLRGAAICLICIMALQLTLGFAGRWIAALLGVVAQNRMQCYIFERLLRSEWYGREHRHSGDVLNRLITDSNTVVSVVTDTLPQMLAVLVRLLCAFFFLFSMDARLAVGVTVIIPVFILLSRLYVNRMRAITREVRQTDSRVQATLQESIQHRLVLKTLERVPMLLATLRSLQATLREQVKRRTLFSSTSNLVLNMGFGGAYLFTFLWSVHSLASGVITFGMMTAFIQLCGQIQGPFRDLTRFIPAVIGSFTAAERLMELEDVPVEEDGEPVRFEQGAGIRFNDVSFKYKDGSRNILRDVAFDFPIGSCTAVLGETGAGKTTMLRLILALLKPNSGKVEMYDLKHSHEVSALTRCNIVYVPQGNTLFSGSLRWNLRMGCPEATDEEMWHALDMACADFVKNMPAGLDTELGEGGAGLSEGQAQRIAIARALLRKGSILLLDEATSALDTSTEQRLIQNIISTQRSASAPITIIFITHRPTIVDYCSQVITLARQ